MYISSHRLRAEEKKLYKRLLYTVITVILLGILFITAGLPLLVKVIVTFSSIGKTDRNSPEKVESIIFPPALDPLPEATNSASLKVAGIGDKESSVIILLNGKKQPKVMTDKDGKFISTSIRLKEGENIINAVSTNGINESSPSTDIVINFIQDKPNLDIEKPAENEKVTSDENAYNILGTTDPGNRITINGRYVIVSNDGTFQFKVNLSKGENRYKVIATDPAGNQTEDEKTIEYSP